MVSWIPPDADIEKVAVASGQGGKGLAKIVTVWMVEILGSRMLGREHS